MNSNAKFVYLTRLSDTTLVLSHRLAELCGKGPALEEDMALANVSLDLLGQARMWLGYAGEVEGAGRGEDELAYLRGEREFHNFLLAEIPNRNYAEVLMRQFYFDAWHALTLAKLAASTDARIAEIAAKAAKEVAYHLRRSSDLVVRLGDGSEESHARMQAAANELWQYTGEMFLADDVDRELAASGAGFDPAELQNPWMDTVTHIFAQAKLQIPPRDAWMQKGGKQGRHTEHLGYLLAEMQVLPRTYAGAQW